MQYADDVAKFIDPELPRTFGDVRHGRRPGSLWSTYRESSPLQSEKASIICICWIPALIDRDSYLRIIALNSDIERRQLLRRQQLLTRQAPRIDVNTATQGHIEARHRGQSEAGVGRGRLRANLSRSSCWRDTWVVRLLISQIEMQAIGKLRKCMMVRERA
jgi:hypothetical protein